MQPGLPKAPRLVSVQMELEMWLSGWNTHLAGTRPWVSSLCPHKPGAMVHTCHPNKWEVETGGSKIQGHPQLTT